MITPTPRTIFSLAFATQASTLVTKNTNSLVSDSKTTLEGLDHQHLWLLEKAVTSTISDLKIFQGITPIEDMKELFGYKTPDTKKAHSSLSEKPWKPYLGLAMMSFKYWKKRSRFGLQTDKLWPFYVCWFLLICDFRLIEIRFYKILFQSKLYLNVLGFKQSTFSI